MAPLIELEHIVDALQGFKRPLREGREAMVNLVVCGISSKTDKEVKVEALCVRTTKISEPPLQINVRINPSNNTKVEDKITSISCSCPSGASKEHSCKHAMACLLFLERNDESDLERLTCTDIEQRWGGIQKETMSQFDPIPISEFCHIGKPQTPYRRLVLDVTEEMRMRFRNLLIEAEPESEAALFFSGCRQRATPTHNSSDLDIDRCPAQVRLIVSNALENPSYILKVAQELGESLYAQCTPEQRDYYDTYIKIGSDDALKIINVTVDQDGDEWFEYKYGRLTGSISYGYHTYYKNRKNHNDNDWNNKIESTYGSKKVQTGDMQKGLLYENSAREAYEQEFRGRNIQKVGIFINPLVPWLGFSADGVVCVDGKIDRLWEVKTPAKGQTHKAETICSVTPYMKRGNKLQEKHQYYGQVQLGMLLLSLPICDFTLYCYGSKEIYVDTVVFNDKFCLEFAQNLTNAFFTRVLPWLVSNVESL